MFVKELCYCVLDQFFSKIAGWLKNHCAWDREALLNAAREGYHPWWTKTKPVGINLSTAANFSHWIKDYLTIFHNITDFQQFEITRIEEVTVVRARRHCGVPNAGWSSIGGERTDGYTPVSFCLSLSLSLGLSLSLCLSLSLSILRCLGFQDITTCRKYDVSSRIRWHSSTSKQGNKKE